MRKITKQPIVFFLIATLVFVPFATSAVAASQSQGDDVGAVAQGLCHKVVTVKAFASDGHIQVSGPDCARIRVDPGDRGVVGCLMKQVSAQQGGEFVRVDRFHA